MEKYEKFNDYQVDQTLSMPKRIAEFLYWASSIAPKRPVGYPQLTKIVMVLAKTPSENDGKVLSVRKACKSVKPILIEKYERGFVSIPGFGVRCTINPTDTAATQRRKDEKVVASGIRRLDATRAITKPNDITDPELRASVIKSNAVLKILTSPEVLGKLLMLEGKKDDKKS